MVAFNINTFNSHIKKTGVLQNNKFLVNCIPPTTALLVDRSGVDALTFRAENVNLPGINLELINTNRYGIGPAQRFPTNVQYTDTFITYLEDDDRTISRIFTAWIWSIFKFTNARHDWYDPEYTLSYKEDYSTNIEIIVYNNRGNIPRVDTRQIFEEPTTEIETTPVDIITLKDAFPVSLNEVNLNHNAQNNLVKINVGISFSEWAIKRENYAGEIQGEGFGRRNR